ncbi:MAG: 1-acyl-sn-glycerol-3-phosphate acyltransferase [Acidibrevibacterium sp.]|jgi:1-acyl-sn-glycerol-3-phosphate acyltransferase|uniref:lysophospholipid acyltransferase family protein n=1 Tax=Acidibrevibacterium fodinaquatile TaxID=1969806 RepID=UPI0023A80CCF|nr:lysophospholipid acyltransferase family protein [Acidibrevibacterium fodinaquatile]MCA7119827.1 1-acyl-sn-glycerol-3-phosphate acyltransferase [Acidibrevibacterium fodinaquatile]
MMFLRSALFNLYFFLLTFVLGIGGLGVRWFARRRALAYAQFWARLVLGGSRWICGIYPVLIGFEHLPPAGPVLLASQHQSAYDTLVWLTLLAHPTYVMKRELKKIPLFGPLTPLAGMILVDRAGGAAALRGLLAETRRAVAEGRQIVIFPEGTRTLPGERRALQPGVAAMAAAVKLPVVPVATDSGRRWGKDAFFKRPGPIHLVVCPPLPAGLPREALLAGLQAAWDAAPLPRAGAGCG